MKFEQFALTETQQLDEVRMGQSDLDLFAESPEAEGIKAGFEAELCFRNLGGSDPDYDNPEEDMEPDERAYSIDGICDFFHDGDYNGRREVRDLRQDMENAYGEWRMERMDESWSEVEEETVREYIEENEWDFEDAVTTYMQDQMDLSEEEVEAALKWLNNSISSSREHAETVKNDPSYAHFAEARDAANEHLNELVEIAISDNDNNYDNARGNWLEDHEDDYDEREWLSDIGVNYMSDVPGEFRGNVSWPYYTYPESESGFNESGAGQLAQTLRRDLDVEVKVGSGYHSVKRTASRWIIEADSSLEAEDGDMPAEIVSPPMPLNVCLQKITEFWEWAKDNDAYTNDSTGLHVGVSLPHIDGRIDYVKLALFLGDKYVLEQFGRMGNYFCKNAFDKIKDSSQDDRISSAFELLRKGLVELASKTLKQTGGHGKYTSINIKDEYVEFRSMGGDEYLDKLDEVKNTVKRYAYAMYIAGRPDLHREEYAKKLYKMLSKSGDLTTIQLFARFKSGILTKEELKQELKNRKDTRDADNAPAAKDGWQIFDRSDNTVVVEFLAPSREHAIQKFHDYLARFNLNRLNYILRRSSEGQEQPNLPSPGSRQTTGEFTGEWKVMVDGREVYRFSGVGNSQADANRVAAHWLRNNGMGVSGEGFEVYPVMRWSKNRWQQIIL